jgi:hypothetical protein
MSSSLDHAISFYEYVPIDVRVAKVTDRSGCRDDFDCSDWMLYVVESPAAGSGRGYVRGMVSLPVYANGRRSKPAIDVLSARQASGNHDAGGSGTRPASASFTSIKALEGVGAPSYCTLLNLMHRSCTCLEACLRACVESSWAVRRS